MEPGGAGSRHAARHGARLQTDELLPSGIFHPAFSECGRPQLTAVVTDSATVSEGTRRAGQREDSPRRGDDQADGNDAQSMDKMGTTNQVAGHRDN